MPKAREEETVEERELEIQMGKRTIRLTVPPDARITFGPVFTSTRTGTERNYDRPGAWPTCLRIYLGAKTQERLLAVFTEVTGMRDLSCPMATRVAEVRKQALWEDDGHHFRAEQSGVRADRWLPVGEESGVDDDQEFHDA